MFSIPYLLWFAYKGIERSWDQENNVFPNEDVYISLKLMHQAGYDMQHITAYWAKLREAITAAISELQLLVSARFIKDVS